MTSQCVLSPKISTKMNSRNLFFTLLFLALGMAEMSAQAPTTPGDWAANRRKEMYKTYWNSIQWLPGTWSELQNDLKTQLVEKWEIRDDSTFVGRRFEVLDGKEIRQFDTYLLEKRKFRLFLTLNPKSEKPVKFRLLEKKEMVFVFKNMDAAGSPGIVEISREDRDAIRVAQKSSLESENCEGHTFRKL